MNIHESWARAKKIDALVSAIDAARIEVPECSLLSLNGWLRLQTPEWWAELSKRAGIRPPSAITIEAVLLTLEARAEESAEAEPDLSAMAPIAVRVSDALIAELDNPRKP
ncbi:MAG: hypothetical protein EPO32_14795 [Anaerolineae bacterium]|nr:MAG: hypothetical protein EPO32_14795 [Anaerolineae bacterium]